MNPRLWKFLTSLKVTVVLLVLSTLLVFLGTLAQVNEGLWEAQERWFKSYFVLRHAGDAWWVPPVFPGGYTLGFSLLFNLIAAHIHRFQWSAKKVGIHLTHAGIVLLLVGQLATDMLSRESFVSFEEGQSRDYSEAHRTVELVVLGEPQNGRERVVSFSEAAVARKQPLLAPDCPFEMRVLEWGENGEVHSHATLLEIGTQMQTAIATMKSKYGTVEALPGEAERAKETAHGPPSGARRSRRRVRRTPTLSQQPDASQRIPQGKASCARNFRPGSPPRCWRPSSCASPPWKKCRLLNTSEPS